MAARFLSRRCHANVRFVLHVDLAKLSCEQDRFKTLLEVPNQWCYCRRYMTAVRSYSTTRGSSNSANCKLYFNRNFYAGSSAQRKVLSNPISLHLPSVKNIEQFLTSKGIPFEHGHTSIVVECLDCAKKEGQKDKADMYINKTTGSYFCKSCGRSGSWRQFKVIYLDQDNTKLQPTSPDLSYVVSTLSNESDAKAVELWKKSQPLGNISESDKQKLLESFGIQNLSEELLRQYQVHVVDHKFLEPDGTSKDHLCVVFPWFDSDKSAVNGVKLVRVEHKTNESDILKPRLGVLGLFGWNTVSPDAKEIVLTLNEFDAIAVKQASSYPSISLPLGTHSLPPEVLPQMEQFERIILWFGDDVRSKQAANQFAKKLNIQRCNIVRPTGDNPPTGPLDALNKGLDIQELITSSNPISHEKIATFQELRNDVYSELVNADQVAGVKWSRFPKLTSLLKGHRRGELTIFTGPTGAGKTTLLSEMSVDLCQQGVNTLWGSFEIRNVRLAKIMMNQFSGLDLRKNVQQFNYWADKFEMLPMYFMCFYGSQNINTVIETMAHAVYVFDIDHVVIDNLQFMTSSLRAEDRFSVQNQAISCLRDFASSKNVHVTLVIHPRKENDDVELQTASIFGTAKASQEADNVLILQDKKGRGEKYLQVTKNRFDGSVGRVPLEFVKGSLSMCGFGKNNNIKNAEKASKGMSLHSVSIKGSKIMTSHSFSGEGSKAMTSKIDEIRESNLASNNNVSKGSRMVTSDVDMISISATPPIQKDSVNTPAGLRACSPGYTKSSTNKNKPREAKGISVHEVEGIRTFKGSVSDSIRSKRATVSNSNNQKLDAKKLYSKTIASLVAKHVNKNRLQEKKLASFGRLKTTSSSTAIKK